MDAFDKLVAHSSVAESLEEGRRYVDEHRDQPFLKGINESADRGLCSSRPFNNLIPCFIGLCAKGVQVLVRCAVEAGDRLDHCGDVRQGLDDGPWAETDVELINVYDPHLIDEEILAM